MVHKAVGPGGKTAEPVPFTALPHAELRLVSQDIPHPIFQSPSLRIFTSQILMTSVVGGNCNVVEKVVNDFGLCVSLARAKAFEQLRHNFAVDVLAILPAKTVIRAAKAM